MKRVNVYLTEQQIAALQQLSQETGLKFAELVRRAMDQYLWTPDTGRRGQRNTEQPALPESIHV